MVNEVKTWLKDIEQAIIEINLFIPEKKNFKDFQRDLKTRSGPQCLGEPA